MHEGLDVLRILFFANLLASERDTVETIEIEHENAQHMNVELSRRRQQRLDDDDDDDITATRRERNEENRMETDPPTAAAGAGSSSSSAVTTPTSPTGTAARGRTTNSALRASLSGDDDELESIYENPLKIRLGLEPNEYRHGVLPFDDFINEFANEKIEISKEYLSLARQQVTGSHFSFISYPFFLSTINKIALLNIENKVQMYRQRHTSFFNSLMRGIRMDPVFKICLRRTHLIEDALIAVS